MTGKQRKRPGRRKMNRNGKDYLDNNDTDHEIPITFAEFLEKPEALFVYESSFFQLPGYLQLEAEQKRIEEDARTAVVQYLIDEFEARPIGMFDFVRWAKLFKNRCESLTPSFWSQVNMVDLIFAKDLENDQNKITRENTGTRNVVGSGGTTTQASSESSGHQSNTQDITNTQSTDTSTREANATLVRAADAISADLVYDWADAADNVHEIRNRSGDSLQHMTSTSDSKTSSSSTSTTTRNSDSSSETSGGTTTETQDVTNKQYMQERQWAVQTARDLLPLDWLVASLRSMFYMLY